MINPYLATIRQAYSGVAAKEDVAAVIRHHRIQASPGYRAAAYYVLGELQKAGLTAEIESYPANYQTKFWQTTSFQEWEATQGTLQVVAPVAQARPLADYREMKLSLIQRSAPFVGEVEVVLLEDGLQVADYAGLDVAGKVVLSKGPVERVRQLAVEQFGAVGILFDGLASAPPVREAMDLPDARQYTSFWWTGRERPCFGFVLSPRQGQWLRGLLRQGSPVVVRVEVAARFYDGEMELVTAVIPGRTHPQEAVILVSHLCHPQPSANDNATGVAANLEAARTLARLIDQGKLPRPARSIRFLWLPEMTGSYAYLSRHEAEIPGLIAGLNLDMVGADQAQTGSVWLLERPGEALASFAPDLLERLREALFDDFLTHTGMGGYPLFRYASTGFSGGSDHYIFSDPTVGVPMPMFIQWPDKFYHTSADTLDRVDPASLARTGSVAAAYAYFVAQAGERETTWLAYEMLARFQARLGQEAQTAVAAALAGEPIPVAPRLAYQQDRFRAALETLRRLWTGAEGVIDAVWAEARVMTAQAEARVGRVAAAADTAKPAVDVVAPPIEAEVGRLIPRRTYRGPWSGIGALAALSVSERDEWQLFSSRRGPAAYTMATLAEYWANGERTIAEIVDLVEWECGRRDVELVVRLFRLLARLGLVVM